MKEKNNKMWKSFLINVLGVIVGIMLTFGGNALWQKREENKKIKEMLILVRNELTDCKEWFQEQEKVLKNDGYVYGKILEAKDDLTSIPADTLKTYLLRIMNIRNTVLTTSAWEIFQNSEMIQKMSNKELVIRLANCYSAIILMREFTMKEYWDPKMKILSTLDQDPYRFFDAAMKTNEYLFFFGMFSLGQVSVWQSYTIIDALIDYTIMLLDKYGDYRYDMGEKDKEMNSFINARIDSVFQKKDTIK